MCLYADHVLMAAKGQLIAKHSRRIHRARDGDHALYGWRHYLSEPRRKPGTLRNGAPFVDLADGCFVFAPGYQAHRRP